MAGILLSPRGRKLLRLSLAALLAAVLALGGYACAGWSALRHEIRDTPRDPRTGVVRGTEARQIDPPAGADTPTTACLLIHGFIGSRKDFADLGERLAAAGFHVDLMRLPGHGATPPEFDAQTPESLLHAVLEEYRALRGRYRAVHVVGFSMGGSLATLLAAQPGVRVDRLVLAAPYYGVTYKWYYGLPPSLWNGLLSPAIAYVIKPEGCVKVNRREALKEIYTYRCVPTRGVATLLALGRRARHPETLQAVRCPTLMLISDGDDAASPDQAHAAYARLGSRQKRAHWLTARSNHHLFWDHDREEVKATIVGFLKNGT